MHLFAKTIACVLALSSWLIPGHQVRAQEVAGGLINRNAVAVDSGIHRVFSVDPSQNAVVIYDEETKQQRVVEVGQAPVAVAIDEQMHRVYVVNSRSGNVSVLDGRDGKIVATVATDRHPYAIGVNSKTHQVLVSNTFSNKLTVIDGTLLTSEQLPRGSKDAIAIDAVHGTAYLISYEDPSIEAWQMTETHVRALKTRIHLWDLVVDASRQIVYATAIGDHALEMVSTASGELHEVEVGRYPCAVVLNADGTRAYVANREDGTVSVIDTRKRETIATVTTGKTPQAITVDPRHHRVVVANTGSGTITVIDTATNRVIRTIAAGAHPYALAIDESRGEVFVAGVGDQPFRHLPLP